ncbi:hypothetical protein K469DRAFT_558279 [Zopfia rhizophila CBS 207.26]|uniref:Uncharacterized protein n=1 Tax=Zopfia rhizophila CBS 207.26 TaxID=1314779 RepID=A0A6A6ENB6_9PEZI|nr:hypothetical protein K469DRAFT_558279 [Zopfia rhizophila CBS 207.26]
MSYGAILSSTFATLFLERVGSPVLGGVADPDDYRISTLLSSLPRIANAVKALFQFCHLARPERCPFHMSSEEEIEKWC